ncbi:MAG: APC family permease [Candidatus Parvarchaeota archaeon]
MAQSISLEKDSVGFWLVVAQSLTTVAPLMDLIAFITTAALFAYGALPLAFLFAFVATFLSINTIFQFSKKIASSGGYYTFVGKGLGPRPGLFTGWIYLIYTWFIVPNEAIFFGALFFPAAFQLLTGITLPATAWVLLSLVLIIFVFGMSYLGIKPSLKYSLITGGLEVAIMIIFSLVVMAKSGSTNTIAVFTPRFSPTGWNGVLLGMIFSVISFGGSGTPVTLGEEAKLPHRTIGRAVITSMLITGITITLAAYALTIGWGPSQMSSFGTQLIPGIAESKTFIGIAGAAALTILGVNSFFNSALSSFNAGIRITYSIARDGILLPARLAKIHKRFKSPHYVIFLNIIITLILAIPIGYAVGPLNTFLIEVTGVTVAYFIYHILTNVSLGVYFHRINELNILKHIVIPAAASIFFAVILFYSIIPITYPVSYGTIIVFIWAIIGIIVALIVKRERLKKSSLFFSYEAKGE